MSITSKVLRFIRAFVPWSVEDGGTGSDLSATGPGFLKQATTGGVVTVAGLAATDLPTSGATPGTYGSASAVGVFTVDTYGRVTSATNTNVAIDAAAITSGTIDNSRLNSTVVLESDLIAGSGISITGTGSLTIASTITQYTDEMAQDAVGNALNDSPTIIFAYDDGVGTISALIAAASIGPAELNTTGVSAASYGSASQVATFTVDANGRITTASNTNIAIAASAITSGQLSAARGGTGLDGSSAANGQIFIGNGSGFTLATMTAGSNISITNGSGTITIGLTGTLPATVGGTGQSTYATGDILYASAANTLARLGRNNTWNKHILTLLPDSDGQLVPRWRELEIEHDLVLLGSNQAVNNTSFTSVSGMTLSLPRAGVYLVVASVWANVNISAGTDGYIQVRLRNTTSVSDVLGTLRFAAYVRNSTVGQSHDEVTLIGIVAASGVENIALQALFNSGPTYTTKQIVSGSIMFYFKIA